MNQLIVSLIRTYVPIAAGAVLTWLSTTLNVVDLDVSGGQAIAVALVTGGYYTLARVFEGRYPTAGVLLGHTTQPQYPPADRGDVTS